jgi:hypothetical protein
MTTQIQKLLERTAGTAAVSFESIGPDSYYTASLDVFLNTVVNAAIADGVKPENLVGILIGCAFHAMDEASPSRRASLADIDKVLNIAHAQHARIAKFHNPTYIEDLKKDAAAFRASRSHH